MEARSPIREKPDTRHGFEPRFQPSVRQTDLAQEIFRLDGELTGFHIHREWMTNLRREAYVRNAHASASIEGNPLSIEEAELVIRLHESKDLKRPRPSEREIVQHYEYFQELARLPFLGAPELDVGQIEATHSRLLKGILPEEKRVGRVRGPDNDAPVYIGRNEGTSANQVDAELRALHDWYYSTGLSLPTPIRVGLWFHEFESIHPFRDGNGRVGRALTHRLLYTDGLPNSAFVALDQPFNEDRPAYYAALEDPRETGRYDAWIDYFLEALNGSYLRSRSVLAGLAHIPDGLTGASRLVMEWLLRSGRSSVSVKELRAVLPQYRPITLTTALGTLAREHGLLVHNGAHGRASRYAPSQKFNELLVARS